MERAAGGVQFCMPAGRTGTGSDLDFLVLVTIHGDARRATSDEDDAMNCHQNAKIEI